MIEDTVLYIKENEIKKALILATKGTLESKLYQNMCKKYDVDYLEPDDDTKEFLMDIIYKIKKGEMISKEEFEDILRPFEEIEAFILGCTELSILKSSLNLDERFIDPLLIETKKIIKHFNREYRD